MVRPVRPRPCCSTVLQHCWLRPARLPSAQMWLTWRVARALPAQSGSAPLGAAAVVALVVSDYAAAEPRALSAPGWSGCASRQAETAPPVQAWFAAQTRAAHAAHAAQAPQVAQVRQDACRSSSAHARAVRIRGWSASPRTVPTTPDTAPQPARALPQSVRPRDQQAPTAVASRYSRCTATRKCSAPAWRAASMARTTTPCDAWSSAATTTLASGRSRRAIVGVI